MPLLAGSQCLTEYMTSLMEIYVGDSGLSHLIPSAKSASQMIFTSDFLASNLWPELDIKYPFNNSAE
jgi:hypothetical protein